MGDIRAPTLCGGAGGAAPHPQSGWVPGSRQPQIPSSLSHKAGSVPLHGCSEGGSHRKALVAFAGNLGLRDARSRSGTDALVQDAVCSPLGGSTWGMGVTGGVLVAMPSPGGLWAGSPQAGCWHQVPGGREPSLGWQRSCRSHPKPPWDLAKAESIPGAQISPDPFSPLSRDPSAVPSPLPCCSPAPSSLPTTETPRSRAQHPASPPRGWGGFSGPCYNQCIGESPPGPLIGVHRAAVPQLGGWRVRAG